MLSQENLHFRKGDVFCILLVLLLAAAVFCVYWPKDTKNEARAEIYQNGNLIHELALSQDQTLTIEGDYVNQIQVRQGSIGITHSTCPGTDCVFSGFLSSPGRSIVCLPNGVEIRLIADEADVDFVVR